MVACGCDGRPAAATVRIFVKIRLKKKNKTGIGDYRMYKYLLKMKRKLKTWHS